jgi:hypothetical protein
MNKATLEKIFEYASMPVHGTLSRKIRKDVLFLGDGFIRITEQSTQESVNTYYDWDKIASIRTLSKAEAA